MAQGVVLLGRCESEMERETGGVGCRSFPLMYTVVGGGEVRFPLTHVRQGVLHLAFITRHAFGHLSLLEHRDLIYPFFFWLLSILQHWWPNRTGAVGLWRPSCLCLKCTFVECPWGGPLGLCHCGSLRSSKHFFPSLVYVYPPRAQNGLLRPSINEDDSQLSLRRSWGHWREYSQAPATLGKEEGLCALGEAGVWNPGWPPAISSSPTRWKEVLFPFKQPHLLPPHLLLFHVQLALSLSTLQLPASISSAPPNNRLQIFFGFPFALFRVLI